LQIVRGATYAEFFKRVSTTAGSTYTLSFYAKSLSGTPNLYTAYNGTYQNPITFTNQWVRYTYTFVASAAPQNGFNLITFNGLAGTSLTADLLVWGVQVEAGAYPTSYIPTVASTVTRNADVISRTGISGLIGQTEGTMFVDVNLTHSNKGINEYLMQVWLDGSNRIIIYRNVSNFLCYFFVKPGGTFSFDSSISANGRHKIAFAYKNADNAFYIDGVQIEVNSSAVTAFSSLSNFDLGIHNASGPAIEIGDYAYKSAELYKTRLSNTELAQLTTL
jgi:hypothetical protein